MLETDNCQSFILPPTPICDIVPIFFWTPLLISCVLCKKYTIQKNVKTPTTTQPQHSSWVGLYRVGLHKHYSPLIGPHWTNLLGQQS